MFDTLDNALAFLESLGGKWIKAKVVTNVDPLNMDRIQVNAPGLYDPNLGDIPWCGPLKMSPFGFGNGYGVFGTPAVGSDVLVALQNGDPNYPVYMHAQSYPNPSEFPSGQAWGWKDPQGNKLVIQGKDVLFSTGGGFQLHIDASGNFTVTTPADTTGTFNVPHVVYNVTDFTVNATASIAFSAANFNVVADTNINGVTIDNPTGNTFFPGSIIVTGGAVFDTLAAFTSGVVITGPATSNGHDIGNTHKHLNQSGATTGIVTP